MSKPGRNQDELGSVFQGDGFQKTVEDISIFAVSAPVRKRDVDVESLSPSCPDFRGGPRSGIEESIAMNEK